MSTVGQVRTAGTKCMVVREKLAHDSVRGWNDTENLHTAFCVYPNLLCAVSGDCVDHTVRVSTDYAGCIRKRAETSLDGVGSSISRSREYYTLCRALAGPSKSLLCHAKGMAVGCSWGVRNTGAPGVPATARRVPATHRAVRNDA